MAGLQNHSLTGRTNQRTLNVNLMRLYQKRNDIIHWRGGGAGGGKRGEIHVHVDEILRVHANVQSQWFTLDWREEP